MLTLFPFTQVFILVLDEHIVIMLIMVAGQPEAEREGVPLSLIVSSPGAVSCLPESPDRQKEDSVAWGAGGAREEAPCVWLPVLGLPDSPGLQGGMVQASLPRMGRLGQRTCCWVQ